MYGDCLDLSPPKALPQWMVNSDYQAQSESPSTSSSVPPAAECSDTPVTSNPLYGPMYTFDIGDPCLSDAEDLEF